MVEIKLVSDKTAGIKIIWGTENFEYLKNLFVKSHLMFSGQSKLWIGPYKKVYSLIPFIERIEDITFSEELKEILKPKSETRRVRRSLDNVLLKSTPMGKFQEEGIIKGVQQNRLLYAWEMGLGKTFAVVSVMNHLWEKGEVDRILVIAPTESVYNFRREFLRFNSFNLKEEDFYIANVNNRTPFEADPKVIIMTYRTFLMLSDEAYKRKTKRSSKNYTTPTLPIENWGTKRAIILDESHHIKNMKARQSKVLALHKHYFEYRYLLSGTPDPNGVEGYFNQMEFLDEGAIGKDYFIWLKEVANIGNRFSEVGINYYYPDKVKSFVDSIKPWVLREFTEGNVELPELVIKKIYTEFNPKQLKIYQDLVSYTLYVLKEKDGVIEPKKVVDKFPFIIQAIDNPCLLEGKIDKQISPSLFHQISKWKFSDHSKLELSDSLLETYIKEEGRKVILWSGHPLTINQLSEYYSKYEPFIVHGSLNLGKESKEAYRDRILTEFKTSKSRNLLIASYLVLSTSVNIVEATRNIFFDRSFDYTYWAQAIKRTHRIGQKERVLTTPLIIENSLDERLDRSLDSKENINANLFSADSLSKEEWKSIFLGH